MLVNNKTTKMDVKITNSSIVVAEQSFEKHLKRLNDSSKFDRDFYQKGTLWFESGLSLEDAPEEFRTNKDFIRGFERGKRLAFIQELDKKKSRK